MRALLLFESNVHRAPVLPPLLRLEEKGVETVPDLMDMEDAVRNKVRTVANAALPSRPQSFPLPFASPVSASLALVSQSVSSWFMPFRSFGSQPLASVGLLLIPPSRDGTHLDFVFTSVVQMDRCWT